ncbi:hypothetical protein BKK47_03865 [Rodentibacter mrazii]|uniref:PEGA domain-containing protein n=1 Tax=Rodentibacter mrazii TaxID=1908257 RepID=A0A1V3II10_9PAST|nr:hypothetical protein [Rodentibacter mrazii]OOF40547.1 hypothetical protein BKK47_03865 [Rodentibacter mrazii]
MKKFIHIIGLSLTMLLTGCATIVSKSTYPVYIQSEPVGATFTIKNSKGQVVAKGETPKEIRLKASAGYFKPATYILDFQRKGYAKKTVTITATLDGWYMGNIALLSPLGALIIDPLTGAMYKLPSSISTTLDKNSQSPKRKTKAQLQILYLDTLTDEQKAQLVAI